ncbi:hypothetical protein SORBI_3008G075400 [Sorghum bicolor]|uniref:Uncharacterized protein n=1 Tax=Sorghum bicolor TaxID=4558 RepID=A0A1Z5R582_SORBI|nr:hypothetical protein SORBI_3008G075400 [Sorghum bicolor]
MRLHPLSPRSDMAARGASAAKRMTGRSPAFLLLLTLVLLMTALHAVSTIALARKLVEDSRASSPPLTCCLSRSCEGPCPPTAAFVAIEPPFESLLTFRDMEEGNEGL